MPVKVLFRAINGVLQCIDKTGEFKAVVLRCLGKQRPELVEQPVRLRQGLKPGDVADAVGRVAQLDAAISAWRGLPLKTVSILATFDAKDVMTILFFIFSKTVKGQFLLIFLNLKNLS